MSFEEKINAMVSLSRDKGSGQWIARVQKFVSSLNTKVINQTVKITW